MACQPRYPARPNALALLREMRREKLLAKDPARLAGNLIVAGDFTALRTSALVIECIFEDLAASVEQDFFKGWLLPMACSDNVRALA